MLGHVFLACQIPSLMEAVSRTMGALSLWKAVPRMISDILTRLMFQSLHILPTYKSVLVNIMKSLLPLGEE